MTNKNATKRQLRGVAGVVEGTQQFVRAILMDGAAINAAVGIPHASSSATLKTDYVSWRLKADDMQGLAAPPSVTLTLCMPVCVCVCILVYQSKHRRRPDALTYDCRVSRSSVCMCVCT